MKVTIKGHEKQFNLITIISETVVVDKVVGIEKHQIKGVVYCYDKERKVHKFLAELIEKID